MFQTRQSAFILMLSLIGSPLAHNISALDKHGENTQNTQQQSEIDPYANIKNILTIQGCVFAIAAAPYVGTQLAYVCNRYIHNGLSIGKMKIHGTIKDEQTYMERLRELCEREDVDAIMLDIESPGGQPGSAQALFQGILNFKHHFQKPIVAWVENMCTSAGYHIAAACDQILTTPSAFVGSIGVIIPRWDLHDVLQKYNINVHTIQGGDHKSSTHPYTELQPHEQDMLQSLADNQYHQFVTHVQQQRPVGDLDTKDFADGKIFTGEQALHIGLVDEVGSRTAVELKLKELTSRNGPTAYIIPTDEEPTIMEQIQSMGLSITDRIMSHIQTPALYT